MFREAGRAILPSLLLFFHSCMVYLESFFSVFRWSGGAQGTCQQVPFPPPHAHAQARGLKTPRLTGTASPALRVWVPGPLAATEAEAGAVDGRPR